MIINELTSYVAYTAFLKDKGLSIKYPDGQYEGGICIVTKKEPRYGNLTIMCSVQKHPNCCGSKLLHSIGSETGDSHKYALGGALLWCKMNRNASANYVVADHQPDIEDALKLFKFKMVQNVFNVKSGRHFRTYIINPMEL